MVFIAYFGVELPMQMLKYAEDPEASQYNEYESWLFLIGLFLNGLTHALPFGMGFIEFLSSSIRLRWQHIVYHYFFVSMYIIVNFVYSKVTE